MPYQAPTILMPYTDLRHAAPRRAYPHRSDRDLWIVRGRQCGFCCGLLRPDCGKVRGDGDGLGIAHPGSGCRHLCRYRRAMNLRFRPLLGAICSI